ncbi:hypothetical protein [Arsenophonus endosymbiont of Bemisia tabaci]|nr:hypothetical protein [Arsenophonus endosymbiont of Bemisia tabaci]
MITSNYSISLNLYWRKTYVFVIKIKTFSYNLPTNLYGNRSKFEF